MQSHQKGEMRKNRFMTMPNFWDKITAYVAENKANTANKAEVSQKEVIETVAEDPIDDFVYD